ncbi:MAG: pyrroline-5-carboxylate reductase, partial [Bacillota bacterium]|nr:pyrroline-5-carboxylate reductase [Bacillota bacterium]
MKAGFIGIGNMGGAILSGFAASPGGRGAELLAFDRNEELCKKMTGEIPGLEICRSGRELTEAADLIVLGVKPQVIESVLGEMAAAYSRDKLVVSMAAGVNIALLEKYLGKDAQIVRIMPNTPAKVGEAMTAVCRNENVEEEGFQKALDLFTSIGKAEEVEEKLIDCVIGVSGSSPAYTYMYIEALTQAAVRNGMEESKARIFAAQSVLGAAKMVLESPESLEQLRINVCSPGGTTIEAVNKLFE